MYQILQTEKHVSIERRTVRSWRCLSRRGAMYAIHYTRVLLVARMVLSHSRLGVAAIVVSGMCVHVCICVPDVQIELHLHFRLVF